MKRKTIYSCDGCEKKCKYKVMDFSKVKKELKFVKLMWEECRKEKGNK